MPRYRLDLEYDGGTYKGFQVQADLPTVQGSIERAVTAFCGEEVRPYAQTLFKERLISCAKSLDTSLKEIAFSLEQRAMDHSPFGPHRDSSFI